MGVTQPQEVDGGLLGPRPNQATPHNSCRRHQYARTRRLRSYGPGSPSTPCLVRRRHADGARRAGVPPPRPVAGAVELRRGDGLVRVAVVPAVLPPCHQHGPRRAGDPHCRCAPAVGRLWIWGVCCCLPKHGVAIFWPFLFNPNTISALVPFFVVNDVILLHYNLTTVLMQVCEEERCKKNKNNECAHQTILKCANLCVVQDDYCHMSLHGMEKCFPFFPIWGDKKSPNLRFGTFFACLRWGGVHSGTAIWKVKMVSLCRSLH